MVLVDFDFSVVVPGESLLAEFVQILDAPDVVVMPVREQTCRDGGSLRARARLGGKNGTEGVDPRLFALSGVDEEAVRASAEEVGVCALKGELCRGC